MFVRRVPAEVRCLFCFFEGGHRQLSRLVLFLAVLFHLRRYFYNLLLVGGDQWLWHLNVLLDHSVDESNQ